jgi:hypothetical protein
VQPVVDPRRRRAANLERAGGDALVHETGADGDLAVGEELVAGDVGHAEGRRVEHRVAPRRVIEEGPAGQRRLRVEHHLERLVVDDDRGCGVGRLLAGLGDDGGDDLADVADAIGRDERPRDGRVERGRRRFQAQARRGEDAEDARHRFGVGGVDRRDRRVGRGRPRVGDVRRPGELGNVAEVVEVHAACGEELRIFLADDPVAEDAARHAETP